MTRRHDNQDDKRHTVNFFENKRQTGVFRRVAMNRNPFRGFFLKATLRTFRKDCHITSGVHCVLIRNMPQGR